MAAAAPGPSVFVPSFPLPVYRTVNDHVRWVIRRAQCLPEEQVVLDRIQEPQDPHTVAPIDDAVQANPSRRAREDAGWFAIVEYMRGVMGACVPPPANAWVAMDALCAACDLDTTKGRQRLVHALDKVRVPKTTEVEASMERVAALWNTVENHRLDPRVAGHPFTANAPLLFFVRCLVRDACATEPWAGLVQPVPKDDAYAPPRRVPFVLAPFAFDSTRANERLAHERAWFIAKDAEQMYILPIEQRRAKVTPAHRRVAWLVRAYIARAIAAHVAPRTGVPVDDDYRLSQMLLWCLAIYDAYRMVLVQTFVAGGATLQRLRRDFTPSTVRAFEITLPAQKIVGGDGLPGDIDDADETPVFEGEKGGLMPKVVDKTLGTDDATTTPTVLIHTPSVVPVGSERMTTPYVPPADVVVTLPPPRVRRAPVRRAPEPRAASPLVERSPSPPRVRPQRVERKVVTQAPPPRRGRATARSEVDLASRRAPVPPDVSGAFGVDIIFAPTMFRSQDPGVDARNREFILRTLNVLGKPVNRQFKQKNGGILPIVVVHVASGAKGSRIDKDLEIDVPVMEAIRNRALGAFIIVVAISANGRDAPLGIETNYTFPCAGMIRMTYSQSDQLFTKDEHNTENVKSAMRLVAEHWNELTFVSSNRTLITAWDNDAVQRVRKDRSLEGAVLVRMWEKVAMGGDDALKARFAEYIDAKVAFAERKDLHDNPMAFKWEEPLSPEKAVDIARGFEIQARRLDCIAIKNGIAHGLPSDAWWERWVRRHLVMADTNWEVVERMAHEDVNEIRRTETQSPEVVRALAVVAEEEALQREAFKEDGWDPDIDRDPMVWFSSMLYGQHAMPHWERYRREKEERAAKREKEQQARNLESARNPFAAYTP